jgi:hypothetical protein
MMNGRYCSTYFWPKHSIRVFNFTYWSIYRWGYRLQCAFDAHQASCSVSAGDSFLRDKMCLEHESDDTPNIFVSVIISGGYWRAKWNLSPKGRRNMEAAWNNCPFRGCLWRGEEDIHRNVSPKRLNMFLVLIAAVLQYVHICIIAKPNCGIIYLISFSYLPKSVSFWHTRYVLTVRELAI